MHTEPTAADIEGVARRDRITFQRLAVDLVRVRAAGRAVVRGYDLGPGRKDFGFDAEIVGEFEGLSGRIRVSAKGHLRWADLRRDAADDAKRHPELPLLLLCALPLDARQVRQLREDARAAGVPAFDAVHGSTLAEWLRDAPHIAQVYLRAAESALVPVEQAVARFVPRAAGRAEAGPALETEEAAADEVVAGIRSAARAVLLVYAPDTRPERSLWKATRALALAPSPEALTWVRTDGGAPLPGDAWMSPAFASHPHTFVAPWGPQAIEFVRWWCELPEPATGGHRIVLAVPRGREDEVRYDLLIQGRDLGEPTRVALDLPRAAGELEEFARWLLPKVQSRIHREAFCETYGLRPALMEIGALDTRLLASRGQRAFPDAADLRALALIAVLGSWPPPAPARDWMLGWLGHEAAAVEALADRGREEGWLDKRGEVHVPSSRASRWALVHAWKARDAAGWRRLVNSLRAIPAEALAVLLPGLAEVEQHEEVEAYLLSELAADTWHQWGRQLATLATSGERVQERILELAERALRAGSGVARLADLSEVVRVTPLFPKNLVRALRVCTLLRKDGQSSTYVERELERVLKEILNPHRLPASAARRALAWAPDGLHRGEIGVEEAEALVSPWLNEAVGVEESSGTSFSFGTSAWNPKNAELPACWEAAASVVLALLADPSRARQTAGWRLVGGACGEVALGPRPKDLRPPDPLATVAVELVRASLDHLPPEGDWELRHDAEAALLRVTERRFIPADLAVATVSRFSRDPLFRAWELCVDRDRALPDPEGYAQTRGSRSGEQARRWRIERRSYDVADERAGPLAVRLAEAGCGTEGLFRLLGEIDASFKQPGGGWRGFDVLRAWASVAPSVFEEAVMGPSWPRVPRDLREGLLWAVAPVFGPRLLGGAGAPKMQPVRQGAAAEMAKLLGDPLAVSAADARAFVPAAELATRPAEALATLRTLAAHPDAVVRRLLATWLYRHLLRNDAAYDEFREVVLQLGHRPGGLPAIEALLMLTRTLDGPRVGLLREDLARAFQAHIDGEADSDAWRFVASHLHSFRPLVWVTFVDSPARWWRFSVDLAAEHLRFSDDGDLMSEMPQQVGSAHLVAALRLCPFPLEPSYGRGMRLVDALVERLPYDALVSLVSSFLHDGREDDARGVLISAGAEPALARVIAEVGARIADDEALGLWARRVAFGGLRGWRRHDSSSDDETARSTIEQAEALRATAREIGGRRGRVLDLVADAL